MRLAYKVIALVVILLGFELVFIGGLAYLLNDAERIAARESYAKALTGHTSHILQAVYDAGTAADRLLKGDDPQYKQLYDLEVQKINKALNELEKLVKDDPEWMPSIEKLKKNSNHGFSVLGTLLTLRTTQPIAALAYGQKHQNELTGLKKSIMIDLRTLMEAQETILARSPAKQTQLRQKFKMVITIGFVVNVIIALLIAMVLVRGITSRVSRLVKNTERLAEGKEILPPQPGKDEIAQLDQAFHHMAKSLAEAQRQKQEMIQMISHDLRTPLTSVGSFLEMLKDNTYGDLSDRGVKRCEGASRNVQRLIDLIGNLLDIERMEAGRMNLNHSHFPVEAVLTQAVDSVRDMADKNNLNLSVRSTDIEIYGDLNLLTRVVTNFLSNAVKYSPEGSTITIKAEPVDNSVHVSVADEGVGIPLKSLPFVFERFKQVQSEEKQKAGSGLGLAICKSIVEAHDGEVGVTSEEGKGSTFWFSLPLAKPAAVTA